MPRVKSLRFVKGDHLHPVAVDIDQHRAQVALNLEYQGEMKK